MSLRDDQADRRGLRGSSDEHQGQGLALRLVRQALDTTRAEGLSVLPYCPLVREYISKNREYLDLVPQQRRAKFSLETQ